MQKTFNIGKLTKGKDMPTVKKKDKIALVKAGKNTRFSKSNQPSRIARSNAQARRQLMQSVACEVLKKKPNPAVFKELKDIDPSITKRMTNVTICLHRCLTNIQQNGNIKDFQTFLKIAGLFVEEKAINSNGDGDEDEIVGVEYKEL